jgi:hypothetical protein
VVYKNVTCHFLNSHSYIDFLIIIVWSNFYQKWKNVFVKQKNRKEYWQVLPRICELVLCHVFLKNILPVKDMAHSYSWQSLWSSSCRLGSTKTVSNPLSFQPTITEPRWSLQSGGCNCNFQINNLDGQKLCSPCLYNESTYHAHALWRNSFQGQCENFHQPINYIYLLIHYCHLVSYVVMMQQNVITTDFSYPHNRLWRPIRLWDVKDPTL